MGQKTYYQELQDKKTLFIVFAVFSIFLFLFAIYAFANADLIGIFPGILCLLVSALFAFLSWAFHAGYNEIKKAGPEQYQKNMKAQEIALAQAQQRENERRVEEVQRQREFAERRQELMAQGIVSCPRCGSTAITSVRQGPYADTFAEGYSWAREISGGCTVLNVCQNCSHRFYPGV